MMEHTHLQKININVIHYEFSSEYIELNGPLDKLKVIMIHDVQLIHNQQRVLMALFQIHAFNNIIVNYDLMWISITDKALYMQKFRE